MRPGSRIPESRLAASHLSFQPRVLLLDDALVQLLEQRRRLAQDLATHPWGVPRRQRTRRPGADGAAVVVGQRLVRARFLLVLDHLLGAKELPVVSQVLM
jgi:hypothetical protein